MEVSSRRLLIEDGGVVLIADVSVETTRLAIATLDKVVVDRRELTMRVDVGPLPLLTAITETFEEMLESNDLAPGNSLAMSIGLPGPVDSHVGYAVRPPMMPGWDGLSICRFMAERLHCHAIVDNDVNLIALGAEPAYGVRARGPPPGGPADSGEARGHLSH
jgi:predicted NBD/HSP70 family sugar kinase